MGLGKQHSSQITSHLANERTYLAWLRTSFSLLTLGFATNKFAQFLVELHVKTDQEFPHSIVGTRRFGIGMVVIGMFLILYSTLNYNVNRKRIETENFRPQSAMIWMVGLVTLVFGLGALVLLLQE